MRNHLKVITFAENLAVLLNSGADLNSSLNLIIASLPEDALRQILCTVQLDVSQGQPLSLALSEHSDWFDQYYLGMVKSGEASGNLGAALQRLAEQLENDQALKTQVSNALIYPTILLVAMCLSLVVIVGVILPMFVEMFESFDTDLSFGGRIMLAIGHFISDWGSWILLSAGLSFLFLWFFRNELQTKELISRLLKKIPGINTLLDQIEYARFTSTLSSLLDAGLVQTEALSIAAESFNYENNRLAMQTVILQVKEGQPLGQCLGQLDGIGQLYAHSINAGELGGQLPETLRVLASRLEKEFTRKTYRLALMVEPILIIGLGLVIGFVVYTVFSALQNIGNLPL